MIFNLKRGDTLAPFSTVLKNPDKSIHDLSAATKAFLHVTLADGSGVFTRELTLPTDRKSGRVTYPWLAADWTEGSPVLVTGEHPCEVETIGGGGARLTFPNDRNDRLDITQDIGDGS